MIKSRCGNQKTIIVILEQVLQFKAMQILAFIEENHENN